MWSRARKNCKLKFVYYTYLTPAFDFQLQEEKKKKKEKKTYLHKFYILKNEI